MEDVLLLIARIVFCAIFAGSAVGHFTQTDAMAGYAQARGVPNARIMVLAGGGALVVGVVSLVLGIWADLGALALLCFLVPTAFLMHAFWKETDPQARQMEQVQFLKDISLAGAALAFFVIFACFGDLVGLTITDSAFSIDVDLD
jgi:putative oxidoreductase